MTAEDDKVRVMVVDDHPVWRDGVRADLEASGRVEGIDAPSLIMPAPALMRPAKTRTRMPSAMVPMITYSM